MDSKPLALLIIGIVAGALVGFGGGFAVYNSQIVDLKGSIADTQLKYITLSSQYQVLTTQMGTLQSDYAKLGAQNKTLTNNYNQLLSNNQQLQTNYNSMKTFISNLTDDVTSLNQTLYSDGFLPVAFLRTLNNNEVLSQNVTNQVSLIDKNEPIALAAYGNINNYVISFIKTSHNINFPYIEPTYDVINGTRYISTFDVKYHEVYFKTPTETLMYHEGNAVDLGTLQYAMMKNYQQKILKDSQTVYLGLLDLQDGTQGAAIFVPAATGQVTIIDPAGKYVTREGRSVAEKLAASELGSYYNYYSTQKLVINKFTLYNIDTTNGNATRVFQGSLSDIIAFFSS
jgi:hypothetical protein